MSAAQIGQLRPTREVAVLQQAAGIIGPPRTEVDRHHRLDAGGLTPVHELVGAERVRLGRHPGKIEPTGTVLHRPDPVLPVVSGDEVSARITNDRRRQFSDEFENVPPEAPLIGVGWPGS